MSSNTAIATTVEDRLTELGGISPSRLRLNPPLGLATQADVIAANEIGNNTLVELVDGCLVEKAMGYEASIAAVTIARIIGTFVSKYRLGLVSGADGFFRLLDSTRGPDVAYVALDRLPQGVLANPMYPKLAPNLVVEVLSSRYRRIFKTKRFIMSTVRKYLHH